MSLKDKVPGASGLQKAFGDLTSDIGELLHLGKSDQELEIDLEEALADIDLDLEVSKGFADEVPGLLPEMLEGDGDEHEPANSDSSVKPTQNETVHTRARLAALNTVSESLAGIRENIEAIETNLSSVSGIQRLTRDLLDDAHGDISRANELEVANIALNSTIRHLTERYEKLEAELARARSDNEMMSAREEQLITELSELEEALASARYEIDDTKRQLGESEDIGSELEKMLSAARTSSDQMFRENELLREKQVNLAVDLEKAYKDFSICRRSLEELKAIRETDLAKLSEAHKRLADFESEHGSLHKEHQTLKSQKAQAEDALKKLEIRSSDECRRLVKEIESLSQEIEALKTAAKSAAKDLEDATREIAEQRKNVSDVTAEKRVLETKLKEASVKSETDEKALAAAKTKISEANLARETDRILMESQKQKIATLEKENGLLRENILKFEQLNELQSRREAINSSSESASLSKTRGKKARMPKAKSMAKSRKDSVIAAAE